MKPRSKGEVQPLTPPPPPPPKPKGLGSSSCSASDLLRAEADRIGGVTESKPIHADLRWAYSVAAAWLDCRNDPATIRKWREIPGQNVNVDSGLKALEVPRLVEPSEDFILK